MACCFIAGQSCKCCCEIFFCLYFLNGLLLVSRTIFQMLLWNILVFVFCEWLVAWSQDNIENAVVILFYLYFLNGLLLDSRTILLLDSRTILFCLYFLNGLLRDRRISLLRPCSIFPRNIFDAVSECMYVYVCVCVCQYTHTFIHLDCVYMYIHVYTCIFMCIYVYSCFIQYSYVYSTHAWCIHKIAY